jgi:uncharacterized membrane protein
MNDLVGVLIVIICAIIVAAWGAWKTITFDKNKQQ